MPLGLFCGLPVALALRPDASQGISPHRCRVQPLCGQLRTSRSMSVAEKIFQRMDNRDSLPKPHFVPGPGILLVAANRWSLGARLASGFVDLGCRVAAVCPHPRHPIRKVPGVIRMYRYAGRHPLDSLQAAIEEFAPDIIVPMCDRSVKHLHELHARCSSD